MPTSRILSLPFEIYGRFSLPAMGEELDVSRVENNRIIPLPAWVHGDSILEVKLQ
jgi:hypothetical protein